MSKTETQDTSAVKARSKTAMKRTEQVMYIGPSIKGVASTNTIFNNGLPDRLIQKIGEEPVIGTLIVPVKDLAEARKEINEPASAIRACYEQVLFYLEKGGK